MLSTLKTMCQVKTLHSFSDEDDSVDEYAGIWKNLVLHGVIFLGGGARSQTEEWEASPVKYGSVAVYKMHCTILTFAWINWCNTTIRITGGSAEIRTGYRPITSLKHHCHHRLARNKMKLFAEKCLCICNSLFILVGNYNVIMISSSL